MSSVLIVLIGFVILFALILLRIPIALAMLGVGFGGGALLIGWQPMIAKFYADPYYLFSSYSLAVVPLFLLMGHLATRAGLSRLLFDFASHWVGHRRGGLAIATLMACAGFSTICGSSLATAATLTPVALPEMRRRNYSISLATGSLAAGGTLGILIPPSILLIIYAIFAEQNLIKMFVAALLPALLAVVGYIVAIVVFVRLRAASSTRLPSADWHLRLKSLAKIWHLGVVFILVLGGIYGGVFTPTEAAAVGCAAIVISSLLLRQLDWQGILASLQETAVTTAMIYAILLGAQFFSSFLALAQFPPLLAEFILATGLSPYSILVIMLLFYLLLGCLMESLSLVLITLPLFLPIVTSLDFALSPEEVAIWFGIIVLVVVEVGLITPPIGLNAFVIHSSAKDIPLGVIFSGIVPFYIAELVRIFLLIAFPALSLFLVRLLWN